MSRPFLYRAVVILAALCDPNGQPVGDPSANCTRLAAKLEVSRRTVQRDIDFLRYSLELPIEYRPEAHTFVLTRPTAISMARLLALAGGGNPKGGA